MKTHIKTMAERGLKESKMKIIATIMLAMLMLSFMAPMVLAEEDIDEDLPEPGIGPKSKFYGIENGWDKWRLAWTFNREAKIEKAMQIAEERLAEAQAAAEEGDEESVAEAQARYDEFMERAEVALGKIQAKNEDKTEDALRRVIRVQEKIEAHRTKVSEVHNRILERLRTGDDLSEEQIAHLEEVFGRIDARSEAAQEFAIQRQENLRTRYKVLTGMTDEEIEDLENQMREEINERLKVRMSNSEGDDDEVEDEEESEEDDEEEDDSEDDESESGSQEQSQAGQTEE